MIENALMIAAIVFCFLLILCIPLTILNEKRLFNGGKCEYCHRRLELFDHDSQGGRGYVCEHCNNYLWISYNCVDKKHRGETMDMVRKKDCKICINYKNMGCTNTSLCMCTEDKPYFKV